MITMPPADSDVDTDRPWFKEVKTHANAPRVEGNTLSVEEIKACGNALLDLLRDSAAVREQYYNLSRTWHNNYYKGLSGPALEFGEQWCTFLEQMLKPLKEPLRLGDFAAIHVYVFYSLRRSVLAITGHDIAPDAAPASGSPSASAAVVGEHRNAARVGVNVPNGSVPSSGGDGSADILESFHWAPNGAAVNAKPALLTQLGFSETQA